jgi:hypothetical protein
LWHRTRSRTESQPPKLDFFDYLACVMRWWFETRPKSTSISLNEGSRHLKGGHPYMQTQVLRSCGFCNYSDSNLTSRLKIAIALSRIQI